jgi:hypothetical protein
MAHKPETDLSRYDWTRAERGKYAARARSSLATIAVDRKVLKALGGADRVAVILRALADAIGEAKPKKRRAA